MRCAPTKKEYIRLHAFYWLYKGWSYDQARQLAHVSERQFRRLVQAFNEKGIDGLAIKPKPGRSRRLSLEFFKEHISPKIQDPLPIGQTPWTAVRLWGHI